MRKIRHVLRLAWEAGLPRRQIARSLNLSPTTVGEYLQRAQAAGLSWPLPEALDDGELEARLFSKPAPRPPASRPLPQWSDVHRELKRKGVTLWLLWQEYKAVHPDGLQYSQFCERYRRYVGGLDLVMRQHHRAGERLFVDYAGQTVAVVDPTSGEIRAAQIFVATLGASNYTYAEATWSQSLPDWIGAHIRALEFLGAVPAVLTPDNLKSGVRRVHRYEPDVNPTYPRSPPITARRLYRPVPENRAIKPKWRTRCWWSSVGCWRGFATAPSSRWPSSTPRSPP